MKIYTEINYEWLDDQLVETSSKSFEYEGEVIECGSFGGQDVGGGDPIAKVSETVSDVVTDPVGTAKAGLDTAITTVAESTTPIQEGATNVLTQTGDVLTEGLATGTESLAMNQGIATTLTDLGENINTNMQPIVEEGTRWVDAGGQIIESGLGFIGEKAQEVTNFIHNPQQTAAVTLDKKGAFKGKKTKKDKKDLSVNKAKQRARQSLRIA